MRASLALPLVALLAALLACDRSDGWSPVLEETGVDFLDREVAAAAAGLDEAARLLPDEPGEAAEAVERARRAVTRLERYYLPLLGAREATYNAYRHHHLGDRQAVLEDLAEIERRVLGMAGSGDVEAGELEELIATVGELRIQVVDEPEAVAPTLERLARRVEQLLLKGDLVLR